MSKDYVIRALTKGYLVGELEPIKHSSCIEQYAFSNVDEALVFLKEKILSQQVLDKISPEKSTRINPNEQGKPINRKITHRAMPTIENVEEEELFEED